MTSIFFLTRMPQHLREVWVANMRSQTSPWIRQNLLICECGETKEAHAEKKLICPFKPRTEQIEVQWNLKPIEIWEVTVPDDAVPEVLWYNKVPIDGKGQVHDNLFSWKAKLLRAGIKLEPVPDYTGKSIPIRPRLIMNTGVTVYCLGIKKDIVKEYDFGVEGKWLQEGL